VFQDKVLDDLIILRSDGTPTYNLSVVVDDHDMGVTHIIRGDDHLTNAARQSQIYAALGWETPVFGHVPLIHGPDGAKMSKRHGALGVDAYRAMGYLPAAMRNYLVRLGWSHGDDEIISTEQMIEWFDTGALGRSPARFDFAKLENLNGHYIRASSDADLVRALKDLLPHLPSEKHPGRQLGAEDWEKLVQAMPGLKERAKTLVELWDSAGYLFAVRPLIIEDKAAKLLTPEARERLAALHDRFTAIENWTAEALEAATRAQAEATKTKLGDLAQPLRAALTGRTTSPGIFDVLVVLGREESLARIGDQTSAP
jgi:glutamyl-tRNA synthetase